MEGSSHQMLSELHLTGSSAGSKWQVFLWYSGRVNLAENALGQEDFLQTDHNGNKLNFIDQFLQQRKKTIMLLMKIFLLTRN